jgi:hypothetical protein
VLDTCAILDLFRSQHRLQSPTRLIEMALKAIEASSIHPAGLHIIVLDQVEAEYRKNASDERQTLAKHFRTLLHTGTTLLPASQAADWLTGLSSIETAISAIPDTLISVSRRVSADGTCLAQAQFRLARGIAPGRRGSGNLGDCIIAEHLLEFSRQLRMSGFAQRLVFVSNNVKDFGPTGQPKPPLDADFATLGIDYLPDIEAAMVSLGF